MMGGDGGLTHSVQAVYKLVDINKVQFVTLPFGSGNDTSRVLNWGNMPWDANLATLH